ncbi:hypothetical protein FRB94_014117 [Tulasnella sp. JGI-2019a]|nr:hypothetical protein FRB93_011261 [Tulasnella sp. JGI-2019a]KAG8989714.1 hypothetical protein FRB94_014117 [Tulasnella sp. JGI-2019a]KAG9024707.1 hypothetical protein FRB95_011160 [Tulasnella sp. JGI-2019a]
MSFSRTLIAAVAAFLVASPVLSSPVPANEASVSEANELDRRATVYTGKATYYYQYGVAGACGQYNSDSALIAAMNSAQYPGTCGKSIVVTNTANGKSVTAVVEDLCPGCAANSVDLSVGAFTAIGDEATGVLPITWYFL